MSPFIPILAGVLASKLSSDGDEEEAKKQAIMQMRMQYAQRLSPDMPMYGMQAAQLQQQLAQRRDESQRQMLASLVPAAISGLDSLSAAPDSTREYTQATNSRLSNAFRQAQPVQPINPFRGLDGSEDW